MTQNQEFVELTKTASGDKKATFVLQGQNKKCIFSARNLPGVEIITASDINTYKIMNCASLVLTESSVAVIDDLLKA